MNRFPRLIPAALAILLPAAALGADPAHDHNHGAAAPAPARATAAASPEVMDSAPPAADDRAAQVLRRMRDMHERMAAAKTGSERQKLMAENRRLLQEAMTLLNAPPAGPDKMMGKGDDMGMMEHDHPAMSPGAGATGDPGAAPDANAAPAPGERKRMGGMDMKQCMHMHEGKARHMELMHAVLQALVDQELASAPGK